jgi:hypothetical protein
MLGCDSCEATVSSSSVHSALYPCSQQMLCTVHRVRMQWTDFARSRDSLMLINILESIEHELLTRSACGRAHTIFTFGCTLLPLIIGHSLTSKNKVVFLGNMTSWDGCAAACVAHTPECFTATWHHTDFPAEACRGQCYGRTVQEWDPVAEARVDSGRRTNVPWPPSSPPAPPPPPHGPPGMVNSGTPRGVPADVDCAFRMAAYTQGVLAMHRRGAFRDLFDALQLSVCNITAPPATPLSVPTGGAPTGVGGVEVWVDARLGSDANSGTQASPLATVAAGVRVAREAKAKTPPESSATIMLTDTATHYLNATVLLTTEDSGLTIRSAHGQPLSVAELSSTSSGAQPAQSAPPLDASQPLCRHCTLGCPVCALTALARGRRGFPTVLPTLA